MSDVVEPLGSGRIESRELEQEMRSSFLDYAMSVIVSRALPDARDGLKPVHRRVLYAMHEAGLQPNRPRLKSARVVGDVMGYYHPHGDQSIYDTLVRMAQPFSLRYPLVDGQGNFGNIDDYPAAAMRYTECRLTRLATEMLRDIDMDTVDFGPNYDESRKEPLGASVPLPEPPRQRLRRDRRRNGDEHAAAPPRRGRRRDRRSSSTSPTANVEDLMKHVQGPDFPTGAIIVGRSGIRDAYRTGRGRIVMRARAHVEELRGGKNAIIVTELPYGVKKGGDSGVIKKIADLVHDKVLSEISDVKDHSDRTGMRIQIDLKREAIPQVVLNKLFKHTQLQATFGYNAVALVDGVPRTLSLLELVTYYLDYQREVVTRRSKYELRKARRARARPRGLPHRARQPRRGHRADPRLPTTPTPRGPRSWSASSSPRSRRRRSSTFASARSPASSASASRTSTRTSRSGSPSSARFSAIRLASTRVVREELLEIKEIYGKTDERRTEIVAGETELELEDMIAEEDMVIAITKSGYIKRLPVTTYREQRRGGIGVMGMDMKDDDYIEHLFVASTHDYILFFTTVGKVYRLKVHELPLGSRQSKGRAIVNLLPFRQDEYVRAVIATRDFERGEVPRLRDAQGHRQEDGVRRVQHAAQGGRDHRDQAARGRRAHRRAPRRRDGRRPHGLAAWARRFASTASRRGRWAATRPASRE